VIRAKLNEDFWLMQSPTAADAGKKYIEILNSHTKIGNCEIMAVVQWVNGEVAAAAAAAIVTIVTWM